MIGRLHHVVLDRPDPHVAAATPLVLALGARRLEGDDVFADPAGHPFCLVARPGWADPIPADDPASR